MAVEVPWDFRMQYGSENPCSSPASLILVDQTKGNELFRADMRHGLWFVQLFWP